MGMFHSTYFAYGFQIPDVSPGSSEDLDAQLHRHNEQHGGDVGTLQAGAYDQDMTFLVTYSTEVSLGRYENVTPQTWSPEQYETWNEALRAAAQSLGVVPRAPGWIVVPDLS